MRKQLHRTSSFRSAGRRRFSPLLLVGVSVPVLLALVAGALLLLMPHKGTHAAAVNGDCTLIVPAQPLTAQGLATPYQLVATNADNGPCNEANAGQAAFVQAAVFDPAAATISVYDPLVIDQGTQPAAAPVVPVLPQGAIVGIWFGFNGTNLTLQGTGNSLRQGRCVNGINGSIFGQFAYCNAPALFQAANQAIQAGKLVPPALGMGNDKLACPTVRDFSIVDQDQSDNVTTTYLVNGNGQTAQVNAANTAALGGANVQVNGSDNRLLAIKVDAALGCIPWMAPDLANPGQNATALPLNELQAAAFQAASIALVPSGDPMVLVNNNPNLGKLNAYRRGVGQPVANNLDMASTVAYCQNLLNIAPGRIQLDMPFTQGQASPDAAAANNLFTFIAQRFVTTFEANGLNCMNLLGKPDPITVQKDGNGVAIAATINVNNDNDNNQGGANTPPNCVINGTAVNGCTGTAKINGRMCTFAYDANTLQVNITCPG